MHRNIALGSGHRRRRVRHHAGSGAELIKHLLAGLLSLTLAACATTSRQTRRAPDEQPAAATPDKPHYSQSAVQIMIDSATSMIGQPYRYGGAEPGGFDCSGLVSYAAANAGIRLPRTAAEQMQIGRAVALADLQAGDLIFMHLASKELHVAIALDRQLFVHAPSSGGRVRIDSLLAAPYARGFIGGRRVVSFRDPT